METGGWRRAAKPYTAPMALMREDIEAGVIEELVSEAERLGLFRRLPEADRARSRAAALAVFAGGDAWVFGYGSLMWSPAFDFVESRPATIFGYHRSYCLSTPIGRGTAENPGQTLALEAGGSCTGIVFRIAAAKAAREFEIIWQREMVTGAYFARPVRARTPGGAVEAVTFIANRDSDRYRGRRSDAEIARAVAVAAGPLGRCSDYLFDTIAVLGEHGFRDRYLERLARLVRAELGGGNAGARANPAIENSRSRIRPARGGATKPVR